MLELNNFYIQNSENLTDLFTNSFVIIDCIYNEIIPMIIGNKRNIYDIVLLLFILNNYLLSINPKIKLSTLHLNQIILAHLN
ncbi:Uncharacterised protein [[Clostridium] sordellii]|nr:Uncharacterised protein [[Clostridium] sordellii] [Paeniclostridium sordellii]CEO08517.1 Uncharacterised protein [[Clostridium] sordellii] [Paeniclostridium sordellii]